MSVRDVCLYTQWIASANATPDVSDDEIRPRRTRLRRRSRAITVTQFPSRPATHRLLGNAGPAGYVGWLPRVSCAVPPGSYFQAALVWLPCHPAGCQACHRPARHWRDTLLHLRSPSCDARPSAVGSPGPHLRDDGRPWGHARPACAGDGAPRPG